jgi:hypothetical protein
MASRRSTIGTNPFDVIVSKPADHRSHATERGRPVRRSRFTVFLSPDLQERARNAAFWSPGLTLADLTERAFQLALEEVEGNNGGTFPQRLTGLRGGHPVG